MTHSIIKILAPTSQGGFIKTQGEAVESIAFWSSASGVAGHKNFNILVASDKVQALTDKLQQGLGKDQDWHILTLPVDTIIPRPKQPEKDENDNARKFVSGAITREALYDEIRKGTAINSDFIALVVLSTLVAAIGIITSNLAVVIGAMMIAPLLGPNLALSFGVALGDRGMIYHSIKTNLVGVGLTLLLSVVAGFLMPHETYSESVEFLSRTAVGYNAIALALASGVAAVLSLTSGVSSAMVGVMVAVALMPPAVTFGIALGGGLLEKSFGAGLLLAVNIICVNLAAQTIFTLKGIRPRTWYQRKKSLQSVRLSLAIGVFLLGVLCLLIYVWQRVNMGLVEGQPGGVF